MNDDHDPSQASPVLPPELAQRLEVMVLRVRRIIWLRGSLATGAVLFGSSLALMAVDAAMPFESRSVRCSLAGAAFAAVLTTAWFSLVRPLARRLSLMRMARVLETRHPELQERISSAIELLSMGGGAAAHGSSQLLSLLAKDAQSDIRGVVPQREFTGRSVKPALTAAGAILLVFGLLFAAWPRQTALLLTRAVAPYANIASLQGADLDVAPGDAVVLRGSPLTLRLRVRNTSGTERAAVHCTFANGQETVERMSPAAGSAADLQMYALTFPCVAESFRYRIRLGSGLTRDYQVTALDPPTVMRLDITCTPPPYTKQPARQQPAGVHDLTGIAGTHVHIAAALNRPADATLILGPRRLPAGAHPASDASWTLTLSTNMASHWEMALRDEQGFTGQVDQASIKIIPDRVPVIELRSPQTDAISLPPYGEVTFAYGVSEDFGLVQSELVVRDNTHAGSVHVQPFALQEEGPELWSGSQVLDLARMNLEGVRQFEVGLRVADTLPPELGGPQRAESRVVKITLDINATRMEDQLRAEQKKTLSELLRAAAERLTQASDKIGGVRDRTSEEPLRPIVAQTLAGAKEKASTAEDLVKKAAELCAKSYFSSLAPRIGTTAVTAIEPARTAAEEILGVSARQRPEKASAAMAMLRDAATKVLALIDAIEDLDRKLADVSKTDALAQREKALAEEAATKAMTEAEREAWQKEQDKIAKELAAQAQSDTNAAKQAQDHMTDAQKDMAAAATTPQQDQAQQAARQAANAANQAANAAALAASAASNAEEFAANRAAAAATENAAALAEKAALLAEQAGQDAKQAANRQDAAQDAATAQEKQKAAQLALQAAQTALKAAQQIEQAAKQAEEAAHQQGQGHVEPSHLMAQKADGQAQAGTNETKQAQILADRATALAQTENAPQAVASAQLTRESVVLANRAADLSQEADNQSQQAATLLPEPREAQTQQAADKAQQAFEMARQAEAKALEAIKLATAEQQAAQQEQQAAQQQAGQTAQIQAAAQQAGAEAKQAAQAAQTAAQAAQQAIAQTQAAQDPVMQNAAQQTAEASKLADQAAALATKSEQTTEKNAAQNTPAANTANKQAIEDAQTAIQLAQEAAKLAQQAAKTAKGELDAQAQTAQTDAAAAVQAAAQAAQTAQDAAQQAQQAGAPDAAKAAQLGQQAAQMAQQAGTEAQQAMQSAGQNTPAGDQKGQGEAKQAGADAAKAAALAQQAGAQAQGMQAASAAAQAAAAAAAQAAAGMAQMAQSGAAAAGQSLAPPTQWRSDDAAPPGPEMNSKDDTKNYGRRDFVPATLANIGFPESDWIRFKNQDGQALEESLKSVPPEYRDLVRRYFVELAREGNKPAGGKP